MKLTRRKQFKFYRSYFDVYNELPIKDKLTFMDALLDKQFLGIEPTNLTGMVKLAWVGLKNSIDNQVKGYETKTGDILTPEDDSFTDPMQGATQGAAQGATAQETEEKEKVKNKNAQMFLDKFNSLTKRDGNRKIRVLDDKAKKQIRARLKDGYTLDDIYRATENCFFSKYHQENPNYLTPEFITRADKLSKYVTAANKHEVLTYEKFTYEDIAVMKDTNPNAFKQYRPIEGEGNIWVSVEDIKNFNLKIKGK